MQIEPQTTLALVYKIVDPGLFATTFYVRAVVRDSLSGATLNTVNLTRSSDGKRYVNQVGAPADTLGTGRHIDVTISVYSDSGYSSYAEGLPEILDKYYVRAQNAHVGGGYSTGIDYGVIRKMMKQVLQEEVHIPSLAPLASRLDAIHGLVAALEMPEIPEQKEPDFSPVFSRLDATADAIKTAIGEIPETDLSVTLQSVETVARMVKTAHTELLTLSQNTLSEVQHNRVEFLASLTKGFKDTTNQLFSYLEKIRKIASIKELFDQTEAVMDAPPPPPAEPEKRNPIISKYFSQ